MIKIVTFIIILLVFLTQSHLLLLIIYDLLVLLFLKYGELTEATWASLSGKNKHRATVLLSDVQEQKEWGWSEGPGRPRQAQWLRAAGWRVYSI